ncbi:hypothetical protein F1C16_15485 [Hymenobacter sp. NBH84]|uniref:hypothetical protein n=1 Tax=Hymenobacter sp. NBH84 TaxID=2596915 RepID=UPI001626C578|nr:hypothetical protein [Hymenobacter sp. NBH84]QNE40863.1 hypothetical protein F1C16_15485 [Hymenobacter sp. NBH84]
MLKVDAYFYVKKVQMMKNGIVLFMLCAALAGCKKSSEEDVAPDIAGVYAISTLENQNGETLTFPKRSADGQVLITSEVEIIKMDDYQIKVLRKGIGYGKPYTDPLGFFEIRRDDKGYMVYQNDLYVGSVRSREVYFHFDGKSNNTMIVSLRAQR